jgi:hypothetical protein
MFSGCTNGRRELQALIEPLSDLGNHAHDRSSRSKAVLAPGVGSSPV